MYKSIVKQEKKRFISINEKLKSLIFMKQTLYLISFFNKTHLIKRSQWAALEQETLV